MESVPEEEGSIGDRKCLAVSDKDRLQDALASLLLVLILSLVLSGAKISSLGCLLTGSGLLSVTEILY